jgi:hypothetical protein
MSMSDVLLDSGTLQQYLDIVASGPEVTQDEVNALIHFYYEHNLDKLKSIQEFFGQMK